MARKGSRNARTENRYPVHRTLEKGAWQHGELFQRLEPKTVAVCKVRQAGGGSIGSFSVKSEVTELSD